MQDLKVRGNDKFGSGYFGASRDGGKRKHLGIDAITESGGDFHARVNGTVSGLGYPYPDTYEYRIIQITDDKGWQWRYFYVEPSVELGVKIKVGDKIGTCQDLQPRYPGITQHVHFEIKVKGEHIDPTKYLNGEK